MKTNYSLHPANPSTELFQIENRAHAFPWSQNLFFSSQGKNYLNYQLKVDNKPVAFAIAKCLRDEATLLNIAVDPSFQHKGLGKKLLRHLICQLERRKIFTLWLEVRCSNIAAIYLYKNFGFNEVMTRCDYYPIVSGREDALVMALTIIK